MLVLVVVIVPGVVMRLLWRRRTALLHQPAGLDRLGHLGRLGAVDRAVLELDHRVLPLPRQTLERVTLVAPERTGDDLVVDARLVELPLHAPARMPSELDPEVAAPVELHRHGASLCLPPGAVQVEPASLRDELLGLGSASPLAAEGDGRRRREEVVEDQELDQRERFPAVEVGADRELTEADGAEVAREVHAVPDHLLHGTRAPAALAA